MNGHPPQKSMGDALQTVVRDKPDISGMNVETSRSTALFNKTRRYILALLIKRPCTHLRLIATHAGITAPAASWHLKKLQDAGYIQRLDERGKSMFYPEGYLDEYTIPLAAVLGDALNQRIFNNIEGEPGLTREDLEKRLESGKPGTNIQKRLAALKKTGLISSVRDGRYARYFPTELIKEASRRHANILKEYRRKLTARLVEDGLRPKGTESTIRIPQIHIQVPDEEIVLSLKCELF